ncbi:MULTISPECIES: IclR family transcriptional regulator [unclassified Streptomyces]|uniref:IclR family transcriptional regulator n=1 Tax=unclassified Streptomyces TaxID=2593676 RepID=UPI0025524710|nr:MULTISPECIES: IclR family transcriptional regulator C-terminal domain-containing protein [unclassified Streptomyces]WRZ62734.1 helix-turn-helix domain-containing protein [Streptomyces sp. NBC_01257]
MGESVAGRLFSVLDAFESGGPPALRLTDIAARTGLPAPTALRLVRELVSWGGLERGADGRYRLGLRLRVLGAAAPCPRGLLDAALPALRALAARTGGHADLAVVSDPPAGGVLCLVSGERPPMHATAYGKVLLAAPPAELPRHTRHTVVSPGVLAGQLARVRAAGLAVCAEEFRLGEVSVAAPVRGPVGTVGALGVTVSIGVPLDRVVAAVRAAAARVRPPEPPPSP